MSLLARICVLASLLCGMQLALAAIPQHEVTSLPGFNASFPSKQYSGYISVDPSHGRFLHYWLVLSENDPANDPVVLWMNGGPGCSSLDGFFYEHGPLHFADDVADDGSIQLELNPYRWNKIASIVFLEAPAGVGFSYSETPSDYNTNDTKTAEDNLKFLVNFFSSYPELSKNRFFITGESYAGIYVPTLVEQVLNFNSGPSSFKINLEGFMVGNGCTGNEVGACSAQGNSLDVNFLFGHGLYSQKVRDDISRECKDLSNPSAECVAVLDVMSDEVSDVNAYDIYAPCVSGDRQALFAKLNVSLGEFRANVRGPRVPKRLMHNLGGPDECIDGIMAGRYLNQDNVRQAIHVESQAKLGRWTICTGKINYDGTTKSLLEVYPTLIKNYRVVIYNGDADSVVPYNDNEQWTSGLGIPEQERWRAWKVDDQVAGYVTTYQLNNFTFITVKGAGHMVPQYKPVQAYAMFERFMKKLPF